MLIRDDLESSRVVDRGLRVVHAARSDDDEQSIIPPVDDVDGGESAAEDVRLDRVVTRQLLEEAGRRDQRADLADANVDQTASDGEGRSVRTLAASH